MRSIKILLFCGGFIVCVLFAFLWVATFPFGPFSFGTAEVGRFSSFPDNLTFKSNRFFDGIVFVFINLHEDDVCMRTRIIRVSDNTEVFNENILFQKIENQNFLEPYKANRISLKDGVVQSISDILKSDRDAGGEHTLTPFLLLLPNTDITNGRFRVVVEPEGERNQWDFCFYAPYFLIY